MYLRPHRAHLTHQPCVAGWCIDGHSELAALLHCLGGDGQPHPQRYRRVWPSESEDALKDARHRALSPRPVSPLPGGRVSRLMSGGDLHAIVRAQIDLWRSALAPLPATCGPQVTNPAIPQHSRGRHRQPPPAASSVGSIHVDRYLRSSLIRWVSKWARQLP